MMMQNLPDAAADNWKFISAAYAAAWIAIGGYWIFVHRALKRARSNYER